MHNPAILVYLSTKSIFLLKTNVVDFVLRRQQMLRFVSERFVNVPVDIFCTGNILWQWTFSDEGHFEGDVSLRGMFRERGSFMKWDVSWKGTFRRGKSYGFGGLVLLLLKTWFTRFVIERFGTGNIFVLGKFCDGGRFVKGDVLWQ